VCADTQGQAEPIFGLALLLGIKLMPRMRNWSDVAFYRPDGRVSYENIDVLFTRTVNWRLIKTHWKDMMQVAISIQAGKVLPSMLLRKLSSYGRNNKLYRAFREVGRVARTLFLLEYISDKALRRRIHASTTKVESFNDFCDWIGFGGDVLTSGDPVENEKRIKYTTVVADAVMLHNVVDLTAVLVELGKEGYPITRQLLSLLSPYMTAHIQRFGQFVLDADTVAPPLMLGEITPIRWHHR
jgi:TnpA family transposase